MREHSKLDQSNVPEEIQGTTFGRAWLAGAREVTKGGPLRLWYPDLEMTHMLQSMGKREYDDKEGLRARRHLILHATRGWYKSSGAKIFLSKGIDAKDLTEGDKVANQGGTRPPTQYKMTGKGTSWPKLLGSIDETGEIMPPLIAKTDYLFSSELMSAMRANFTGAKETGEIFNEILEEGHVSRSLVKFGNVEDSEKAQAELDDFGVTFDPENKIVKYDVETALIGCTRPIEGDFMEAIKQSGLWDRMYVSAWNATDTQVDEAWYAERVVDEENMESIARHNHDAWHLQLDYLNSPPFDMVQDLLDYGRKFFRQIEKQMGKRADRVRSGRDQGIIHQLLTGAAWERTVRDWDRTEDGMTVPELEYKEEDKETAMYFWRQQVRQRYENEMQDIDESEDLKWLKRIAMGVHILHDVPINTQECLEVTFRGSDLANLAKEDGRLGCSRRTMYRAISDHGLEKGWLERAADKDADAYQLTERFYYEANAHKIPQLIDRMGEVE